MSKCRDRFPAIGYRLLLPLLSPSHFAVWSLDRLRSQLLNLRHPILPGFPSPLMPTEPSELRPNQPPNNTYTASHVRVVLHAPKLGFLMPKSAWATVASPVPFTARRAAAPIDGDVVSHFKLTRIVAVRPSAVGFTIFHTSFQVYKIRPKATLPLSSLLLPTFLSSSRGRTQNPKPMSKRISHLKSESLSFPLLFPRSVPRAR